MIVVEKIKYRIAKHLISCKREGRQMYIIKIHTFLEAAKRVSITAILSPIKDSELLAVKVITKWLLFFDTFTDIGLYLDIRYDSLNMLFSYIFPNRSFSMYLHGSESDKNIHIQFS